MPELPEVECLCRHLSVISGRTIRHASARDPNVCGASRTPVELAEALSGRSVEAPGRRGKYLVVRLGGQRLLFSLRMTGRFAMGSLDSEEKGYRKLTLNFEHGMVLHFLSVRRLSRVHLLDRDSDAWREKMAGLGPDPLKTHWSRERFQDALAGRRGPLKPLLMDQSFMAGLGNIYANELCFRAAIDPRRAAPDLRSREVDVLVDCLPRLLHEAVLAGGSSFLDFRHTNGRPGRFQRYHRVYDRESETCVRCGNTIQRIRQSGRSTFFCPRCQC